MALGGCIKAFKPSVKVVSQIPIEPKIIEDIAREFQLDQVGPTVPEGNTRLDADTYMNEVSEQVEGLIKAWLRKRG